MKVMRKPKVVNRFPALSTSFRTNAEYRILARRKMNLTFSTVLANQVSFGGGLWLESILEIWHQGAVVFNESGDIIQTTEFTEKMVRKYFPEEIYVPDKMPFVLEKWMDESKFSEEDEDIVLTRKPYILEISGDELRIQLIIDNVARRKTLLFKQTLQMKPSALMQLGLTKRESEVLFVITKGKTNPEIGILLGISIRTVQKHVEHIYVKLGVETRTAAMLRVHELGFEISP